MMSVGEAVVRRFIDDGSDSFRSFQTAFLRRRDKDEFDKCSKLMAEFFKFQVKSYGEAMARSSPSHCLPMRVDQLLADLSYLAFEAIVNNPGPKKNTLRGLLFPENQGESDATTVAGQFDAKKLEENVVGLRLKKHMPLKDASLGFLEPVPSNKKFARFTSRSLAEYLAALHLSSSIWWQIGKLMLAQAEDPSTGGLKKIVWDPETTIKQAKALVNGCTKWQQTLEALPLTVNVVKYFFGLFPYRGAEHLRRCKLPGKMLDEILAQFYKNYHGYALVHRYLNMPQTQVDEQITRNVLETLRLVQNRRPPQFNVFSYNSETNWQLALIEAACESGSLLVAQVCLTEALFNESFYGALAFNKENDNDSSKLYYTMICLAMLLRVGNSFCNLELSDQGIDGRHLQLLVEHVSEVKDISLESIDLSKNEQFTNDNGAEYLDLLLCRCNHLTTLNLSECGIDNTACYEIFAKSVANLPLGHLDLSGNAITSSGCKELLANLQLCHCLTTLRLASNELDEDCCSEIAIFIGKTLLRKLDLSHNKLGNEGVEAIFSTLTAVNSELPFYLRHLKLQSTNITPDLFLSDGKISIYNKLVEWTQMNKKVESELIVDVRGLIDDSDELINKQLQNVAQKLTRGQHMSINLQLR